MGDTPEQRAARLAARQKSMLTGAQLKACGFGRRAITYRVETRRLHIVFRDVYSFTRDQVVKQSAFVLATVAAALARRAVNAGQ